MTKEQFKGKVKYFILHHKTITDLFDFLSKHTEGSFYGGNIEQFADWFDDISDEAFDLMIADKELDKSPDSYYVIQTITSNLLEAVKDVVLNNLNQFNPD